MDSSLSRGKEREAIATKQTDIFAKHSFEKLTPWQQNLYFRIVLYFLDNPNDAALSAEPSSLRCALYPLRNDVRDTQLQSALSALELADLIVLTSEDDGHQYLHVTSAYRLGGDYRGGRNNDNRVTEQQPLSLSSRTPSPHGKKEVPGNAELLGLTDSDITEMLERRELLEREAKASGLPVNERTMLHFENLLSQYPEEWVMEAIKRCALTCPNWRYVDGILRKAHERGTIDDIPVEDRAEPRQPSKSSMKRRKMTKDQEDEELRKWGVKP